MGGQREEMAGGREVRQGGRARETDGCRVGERRAGREAGERGGGSGLMRTELC